MHPRNIGRALGIGVRVAGRIAGQRVAERQQSAPASPASYRSGQAGAPASQFARGQAAAQTARQLAANAKLASRGVGGFIRPFRRLSGILWLEITGAFFLLFAAIFALRLWQNWSGYGRGSRGFVFAAIAVFLYLGASSFWRARRR